MPADPEMLARKLDDLEQCLVEVVKLIRARENGRFLETDERMARLKALAQRLGDSQ